MNKFVERIFSFFLSGLSRTDESNVSATERAFFRLARKPTRLLRLMLIEVILNPASRRAALSRATNPNTIPPHFGRLVKGRLVEEAPCFRQSFE